MGIVQIGVHSLKHKFIPQIQIDNFSIHPTILLKLYCATNNYMQWSKLLLNDLNILIVNGTLVVIIIWIQIW